MDVAEYVSYPRQNGKNMLKKALNALEAIQELHPEYTQIYDGAEDKYCGRCLTDFPCATRRLADEALNTN